MPEGTKLFAISSQAHNGLEVLLRELVSEVSEIRAQQSSAVDEEETDVPVIGLTAEQKRDAWKVSHDGGRFVITGGKIEKFAARTNFDTEPGRRRLWDIISKMGIMHELERQGLKQGDVVAIGRSNDHTMTFGEE